MKYAILLSLLAVCYALGAVVYPGAAIPLGWASVSFLTIAAGYAGLGPQVTGKRKDGTFGIPIV